MLQDQSEGHCDEIYFRGDDKFNLCKLDDYGMIREMSGKELQTEDWNPVRVEAEDWLNFGKNL